MVVADAAEPADLDVISPLECTESADLDAITPSESTEPFRAGFVAIVGSPNVGKSTLTNALLGQDLCIATSKAQTTRHRILGLKNSDTYQLVLSDTPGVLHSPAYALQRGMMNAARTACRDAEVVVFVTDIFETATDAAEVAAWVDQLCGAGDVVDAAADDDADAADDDAADDDADAAADDDDEMTSPARGAFEGSVEEALAYASLAAGCWMDFLPSGVDRWVARRLESAELEWPPRRCASNDAFQRAFVKAAEAADVDDDDAGEQAPDLVEQDP